MLFFVAVNDIEESVLSLCRRRQDPGKVSKASLMVTVQGNRVIDPSLNADTAINRRRLSIAET